mgnify:CR=1 FL=1
MGTEGQSWKQPKNAVCDQCQRRFAKNGFKQHYQKHFDELLSEDQLEAAYQRGRDLFEQDTPEPLRVCSDCGFVGPESRLIDHLVEVEGFTKREARQRAAGAVGPTEAVTPLVQRYEQRSALSRLAEDGALGHLPVVGSALEVIERELAEAAKRLTPKATNNRKKP